MTRTFLDKVRSSLAQRTSARQKLRAAWAWSISSVTARWWLRRCDRVGANPKTQGRPVIENRGRIVLGDGIRIASTWAPVELVTGPDGSLEVGDDAFLNYGTLVSARSRVRIGARVMVGNYSIIADTEVPGVGDPAGSPEVEARAVEIGDDAWLAARVTVLPGCRIGSRAVIAAGSVVAEDIPPGAIAGGIPARVLRSRPDGGKLAAGLAGQSAEARTP